MLLSLLLTIRRITGELLCACVKGNGVAYMQMQWGLDACVLCCHRCSCTRLPADAGTDGILQRAWCWLRWVGGGCFVAIGY